MFLTVCPITRTEMNFHPTLFTFIHTHAHKHKTQKQNSVLPLGLLLSPQIFLKGFHVGSTNTLTAASPHGSTRFFLLGSHPISYRQLSPGPCPPLMPHKDSHWKIILFCLFQSETNQDGIMPFTPSPCSSPGPCPDP